MCGVLPWMWKGFTRLQFVAWSVESCQSELCRVCCVLLSSFCLTKKFSLSLCIVVYVSNYRRNRVLARAGIGQSGLDYVCRIKFRRVYERVSRDCQIVAWNFESCQSELCRVCRVCRILLCLSHEKFFLSSLFLLSLIYNSLRKIRS